MYHLAPLMRFLLFCHVPMVLVYIVLEPSTWNMKRLQLAPRRASELAPELMKTTFKRLACSPMASAEAELISPTRQRTLSRSMSFCALVTATPGLTLSSAISSTFRPRTPPAVLVSSTAIWAALNPYSPNWPRKPVRGVRCPTRMVSGWARTMAGMPRATAPAAAVLSRARRVRRGWSSRAEAMGVLPLRGRGCGRVGGRRPPPARVVNPETGALSRGSLGEVVLIVLALLW